MTVEFNHLYVTLDVPSIAAIDESAFLREEFCRYSKAEVEADGERWTGTYLLGNRAYLELFAPGGAEGFEEGFSGIGFNTVQFGQIDEIEARLEKLAPGRTRRRLRQRQTEEGEVPWFHYLGIDNGGSSGFEVWLMEFHPEYLESREIQLTERGLFDRAAYLKPRREQAPALVLLDDVAEVYLNLSAEENEKLVLLLQACGSKSWTEGRRIRYRGDGFELSVMESSTPIYRVQKVFCNLTAQIDEAKELVFAGRARLNLKHDAAVWEFGAGNSTF